MIFRFHMVVSIDWGSSEGRPLKGVISYKVQVKGDTGLWGYTRQA